MIAVMSSGRPGNVPKMEALFPMHGLDWYVPADQAAEYRLYGAKVCPVSGKVPMKTVQLNTAIVDALALGDPYLCTLDDDLTGVWIAMHKSTGSQAIAFLEGVFDDHPEASYIGPAPVGNPMFVKNAPPLVKDRYIATQFALHRLHLDMPKFDPCFVTNEDWDMWFKHFSQGTALRVNTIVHRCAMSTNRGGFQGIPNRLDLDLQMEALLLERWPQYVTPGLANDYRHKRSVSGHSAR